MNPDAYEPAGLVLCGLPNTGKTSYLALLYLAIINNEATGITLGTYRDDREYLNRISGQLQRCQALDHTEVGEQQSLKLSLLVGQASLPTMLQIPDTSGETWEVVLTERHIPVDLDRRARDAASVMIFVHAKADFDAGTTIVDANMADESALGSPVQAADSFTAHHRSPTQVELVELIQITREMRGPRPSRAAIIISAYDFVDPATSPDEWITMNLPLLRQYIESNSDWLEVAVFGVSAQGGRFDLKESVADLAQQDALQRAVVRGGDGAARRVEDPIVWALERRE